MLLFHCMAVFWERCLIFLKKYAWTLTIIYLYIRRHLPLLFFCIEPIYSYLNLFLRTCMGNYDYKFLNINDNFQVSIILFVSLMMCHNIGMNNVLIFTLLFFGIGVDQNWECSIRGSTVITNFMFSHSFVEWYNIFTCFL